jgi:hypothetical protein
MIVFLIPVRHELSVPDYSRTWKLLNHTLASIACQDTDQWHAVVCANKVMPVRAGLPLDKITFLEYKRDFIGRSMTAWNTAEFKEHLLDKAIRRRAGFNYAHQNIQPQWYFMADADDYVSSDLVSTILSTTEHHHQIVTVDRGLVVSLSRRCYVETDQFNDVCGTSIAFRAGLIQANLQNDEPLALLLSQHKYSQFESAFQAYQRHSLQDRSYAAYLQHDDNHGRKLWAHTKFLTEDESCLISDDVRERFGIPKVVG